MYRKIKILCGWAGAAFEPCRMGDREFKEAGEIFLADENRGAVEQKAEE
jgi:hypothetical protein